MRYLALCKFRRLEFEHYFNDKEMHQKTREHHLQRIRLNSSSDQHTSSRLNQTQPATLCFCRKTTYKTNNTLKKSASSSAHLQQYVQAPIAQRWTERRIEEVGSGYHSDWLLFRLRRRMYTLYGNQLRRQDISSSFCQTTQNERMILFERLKILTSR